MEIINTERINEYSVLCADELTKIKDIKTLASKADYRQGAIDGFRVCGAWFFENLQQPTRIQQQIIEQYMISNLNIFKTDEEFSAAVKGFLQGLEFASNHMWDFNNEKE